MYEKIPWIYYNKIHWPGDILKSFHVIEREIIFLIRLEIKIQKSKTLLTYIRNCVE